MSRRNEWHQAKCEVLRTFSSTLRHAILSDIENLRFELYSERLISENARKNQDAGAMVAEIEHGLKIAESVWDKLISVLKENQMVAASFNQLEDGLRKEAERRGLVHGVGKASDSASYPVVSLFSDSASYPVIDSVPHQQSRVVIGSEVQRLFEMIRSRFHTLLESVIMAILRRSEFEDVKEHLEEEYPELAVGLKVVHSQKDLIMFVQKNCFFTRFLMLEKLVDRFNPRAWKSLCKYEQARGRLYNEILAKDFVTDVREKLRASHAKITFETSLPKNETTLADFKMLLLDLFVHEGIDIRLVEVTHACLIFMCEISIVEVEAVRRIIARSTMRSHLCLRRVYRIELECDCVSEFVEITGSIPCEVVQCTTVEHATAKQLTTQERRQEEELRKLMWI